MWEGRHTPVSLSNPSDFPNLEAETVIFLTMPSRRATCLSPHPFEATSAALVHERRKWNISKMSLRGARQTADQQKENSKKEGLPQDHPITSDFLHMILSIVVPTPQRYHSCWVHWNDRTSVTSGSA